MDKPCVCLLLASLGMSGQPLPFGNSPYSIEPASAPSIQKLKSALLAMKTADSHNIDLLSRQLADSMFPLVVRERQPTVPQVPDFTSEITRALAGRALSDEQVTALQQCIVGMLRGAGISNFALAQSLQETLTALKVNDPQTDRIIRRFLTIGEEVRGLDDQGLGPKRISK